MLRRKRNRDADMRDLAICPALDEGRKPAEIADAFNVSLRRVEDMARELRRLDREASDAR